MGPTVVLPRLATPPRVQLGLGRVRGKLWCGSGSLWESKPFTVEDCFPVGEGDVWEGKPHKLDFTKDI